MSLLLDLPSRTVVSPLARTAPSPISPIFLPLNIWARHNKSKSKKYKILIELSKKGLFLLNTKEKSYKSNEKLYRIIKKSYSGNPKEEEMLRFSSFPAGKLAKSAKNPAFFAKIGNYFLIGWPPIFIDFF